MNGAPDRCSCGSRQAVRLFGIASRETGARSVLMRCPACGSLFPERRPETAEAPRLYDLDPARRSIGRRWLRRWLHLARRPYLARAAPESAGRILDFGCGAGDYLARVAVGRRECFGVDLVAPAAPPETWRSISMDELERFAPYDWITLGHVLEHLERPRETMARLAGLLAPGGAVWIATPNAGSFIFACAGPLARDVDYPRHREIFARAGLDRLLRGVGLCAAYESPPRLNAVLNALTTARAILGEPAMNRARRSAGLARLALALGAHLLAPRQRRDRESPELVAVCRLIPADRPPVR